MVERVYRESLESRQSVDKKKKKNLARLGPASLASRLSVLRDWRAKGPLSISPASPPPLLTIFIVLTKWTLALRGMHAFQLV